MTEAQPLLVSGSVFKTGEGDEKSPWWVRFPCASANYHFIPSPIVLKLIEYRSFFYFLLSCGVQRHLVKSNLLLLLPAVCGGDSNILSTAWSNNLFGT